MKRFSLFITVITAVLLTSLITAIPAIASQKPLINVGVMNECKTDPPGQVNIEVPNANANNCTTKPTGTLANVEVLEKGSNQSDDSATAHIQIASEHRANPPSGNPGPVLLSSIRARSCTLRRLFLKAPPRLKVPRKVKVKSKCKLVRVHTKAVNRQGRPKPKTVFVRRTKNRRGIYTHVFRIHWPKQQGTVRLRITAEGQFGSVSKLTRVRKVPRCRNRHHPCK